jgi:uncharacterized coiled-coil protein SlyX
MFCSILITSEFKRHRLLVTALAIAITISPAALAVKPPPDGDYPGRNTAEGEDALLNLTAGIDNTALGFHALFSDTTGSQNTATGANALSSNTIGIRNTASGMNALAQNISGNSNTADGFQALFHNTIGFDNTASGHQALFRNTTGSGNTAVGDDALFANKTGTGNTATGVAALLHNRTGSGNTAEGNGALFSNTSGNNNIAIGDLAGADVTTGDNNIDIGNQGAASDMDTIRIGTKGTQTRTFIAGVAGVTVANGVGVLINSNGKLGTVQSSARFKADIKPMEKASEAILQLNPVTFRYKEELDPEKIPQFGLVAEDVEKVNPDLVVRDEDGKLTTVRYEAVNAMLLNEFLKEHRKGREQDRKINRLEATVAQLQLLIEEQAAQIQKVSEQLSKAAPQMVASND